MPSISFTRDEGERLLRALQSHDRQLYDRVTTSLRSPLRVVHNTVGGEPKTATNTVGGGWHHTAIVGRAPEHHSWTPVDNAYPPEVHHTARLEAFVTVDSGMQQPTRIGAGCFLLAKSHVGHDAVLEDDVTLATGAIVGGHAIVKQGARIGLNATVLPYRRVGRNAVVGAGAVVTEDVPDGATVAGVPARPVKTNVVPFTRRRPNDAA